MQHHGLAVLGVLHIQEKGKVTHYQTAHDSMLGQIRLTIFFDPTGWSKARLDIG